MCCFVTESVRSVHGKLDNRTTHYGCATPAIVMTSRTVEVTKPLRSVSAPPSRGSMYLEVKCAKNWRGF